MPLKSQYELEREANIAKNRALFEQLGIKEAVTNLGGSSGRLSDTKAAKPVQPTKRIKRERDSEPELPRRQSRRLLTKSQSKHETLTPEERATREEERERLFAKEEEGRLLAQEQARAARRPRHDVLNFKTLVEANEPQELSHLSSAMDSVTQYSGPRRSGDPEAFVFDDDGEHQSALKLLREQVRGLGVISRAKVTMNRVYSVAYHPEVSKDLIFFGDKHGQLGIWDARAPPDEEGEEDSSIAPENKEGGKYWRLQLHWPASPKSSISNIKIDPISSHNVYTSSYDCTVRSLSFVSGISKEVYATDDVLITSIDLPPSGQEMWIADGAGGVTHVDLREDKSDAQRYSLSNAKIGSVSVNPTRPNFLLTASNSRFLKIWDVRKLNNLSLSSLARSDSMEDRASNMRRILDVDFDVVEDFMGSAKGKGMLRGEYEHEKSASSAFWDPRGRQIVSTSYDDTLRLWDLDSQVFKAQGTFPGLKPFCRIKHNCQTGKWLTILRAQWSPNPDTYPHFTVGNMNHSLDIYSSKGELVTQLHDRTRVSAVQAVTCSHPRLVERAVSGNASGRCVLWAPESLLND